MSVSRAELIFNYRLAKQRLTRAQEAEKTWRLILATSLFETIKLGVNWTAKRDVKLTTKVNVTASKDMTLINEVMTKAVAAFPEVNFNAVWESKLIFVESEYDALPDEAKLAIAPLLTIKPGLPSIEIPEKGK